MVCAPASFQIELLPGSVAGGHPRADSLVARRIRLDHRGGHPRLALGASSRCLVSDGRRGEHDHYRPATPERNVDRGGLLSSVRWRSFGRLYRPYGFAHCGERMPSWCIYVIFMKTKVTAQLSAKRCVFPAILAQKDGF